MTCTGPQVDGMPAWVMVSIIKSGQMAFSKIHHMNIIPDTCSILGGVVIAKNTQVGA